MNSEPQVSQWLKAAKAGNGDAVDHLWKHYYPQMLKLAQKKLAGAPKQMADEEDVALSAFKSFCKAAEQGRFPELKDRDGLWRLLFRITARKAVDHWRRETSEGNGGGRVQNEADLADSKDPGFGLDQLVTDQNTPEFATIMAEACEERLKVLTPQLRQLALAKLAGYTNRETAEQLGTTEHAVEYGLKVIRRKWAAFDSPENEA